MVIDSRLYPYVIGEEEYADKALIVAEGAQGDWIYLILEGRVVVKKKTPKGIVKITTLEEGAVFGEQVFLQMQNSLRTASVVASGAVKVGLLDMDRLRKEFRSISPLLKVLISTIAKRLQDATDHLISLSLNHDD
jgi:CRP-like cAMP-binding protein